MAENQKIEIEIKFKDVELTKLDVKPGETLAVTIKSDDIDGATINEIKKNLSLAFPGVRVLIFGISLADDVKFTAVTELSENKENNSCANSQFCVDCSCGKKEQYEKQD